MISVRLSEDEFTALRRLCIVSGARSVSDLARDAMQLLLKGANHDDILGSRMDDFRAQIVSMDRKIEQLTAELTLFKADG